MSRGSLAVLDKRVRERLAVNVRQRRTELGLGVRESADLASVKWEQWEAIERGELNPRMSTLSRIGRALKLDPGDLLREVQTKRLPQMVTGKRIGKGSVKQGAA
jgi:predicted transcriptional regulator